MNAHETIFGTIYDDPSEKGSTIGAKANQYVVGISGGKVAKELLPYGGSSKEEDMIHGRLDIDQDDAEGDR